MRILLDKLIKQYFYLLIFLIIAGIHGSTSLFVGFVSDDWDLLRLAPQHGLFQALENHHFSPFVTSLFKLSDAGYLTPFFWHLLGLSIHFINCILLGNFLVKQKYSDFTSRWTVVLFAISSAGLEALIWCCALPYVFSATLILFGLNYALISRGFLRLTLLFALFFVWDSYVFYFPLLLIFFWGKGSLKTYVPCFLVFAGSFWLRGYLGIGSGYTSNSFAFVTKSLLADPMLTVFPQFTAEFYSSIVGKALGAGLLLSALVAALYFVELRRVYLSFFLLLVPAAWLSYPQSRYFYLPALFLFTLIFFLIEKLRWTSLKWGLCIAFASTHLYWASTKAMLWRDAYTESQLVKSAIEQLAEKEKRPLVVINLPDRYGPPGLIWRPYMWRCGYKEIAAKMQPVRTRDNKDSASNQDIPLVDRKHVPSYFPDQVVVEVTAAGTLKKL